jgi:bifunctional DNA-binding transcriptional regulator/antitoxin component of YhaV-PrlF toxin-antitoxin module
MSKSNIDDKHQTPLPNELREKLDVDSPDVLQREVSDDYMSTSFLKRRGAIRIGAGSAVGDVRKARSRRGIERA